MENKNVSFFKKVKEDEHKPYMVCAQYISWNESAMGIESGDVGYIVQEVMIQQTINDVLLTDKHYYEAWKVENGKVCLNSSGVECHDTFRIGHPMDYYEELKESIYKHGRVEFHSKVFWINSNSGLYDQVDMWNAGTVVEAGNLKSEIYTEELEMRFSIVKPYCREFVHDWDFTSSEVVYAVLLDYFRTMYKKENSIDCRNFETALEDLLAKDDYNELRERIRSAWYA